MAAAGEEMTRHLREGGPVTGVGREGDGVEHAVLLGAVMPVMTVGLRGLRQAEVLREPCLLEVSRPALCLDLLCWLQISMTSSGLGHP